MLTIMALNTANYHDHPGWDTRLPLIVSAIAGADADVIGLSEIRYEPGNFFNSICSQFWSQYNITPSNCSAMDTGEQILTLLQTYPGYENAQIFTDQAMQYEGGMWEGLSMISRLPVSSHGYQSLTPVPDCGDDNKRITQWAEIELPGGSLLYFYNTHFSYGLACRIQNAKETMSLIGSEVNDICCLVGDLNATPDDPAIGILSQELYDVWPRANPNTDGYTYMSRDLIKRIDYCWGSATLVNTLTSASVVATEAAGDVVFPSDHIGVVAMFDIS